MANYFHSERNINYMTLLLSPVIGSAIWIGGGGAGLVLVVIVVVLLLRR
jgi:cellobiose-specific phosphotransferase system component IIC